MYRATSRLDRYTWALKFQNVPLQRFRAVFEVMDMPMDWPVEVNYHEAKAFCAWKGPEYRLPTEAEHHVMRGPQVCD